MELLILKLDLESFKEFLLLLELLLSLLLMPTLLLLVYQALSKLENLMKRR